MTTGPTRPSDPAGPPFRQPPPPVPPSGRHAGGDAPGTQSPSGGATVLGVGVGLFGTGIGLAVLISGSGLFLDAAPPGDLDLTRRAALGLVLFIVGVVVLAAVMATGLIAPSAPIVGGVIATLFGLVGAIAAYVDDLLQRGLETVGLPDTAQAYITNWLVTGAALTVGILLLIGGLVISALRRRAVRAAPAGPPVGPPAYGPPQHYGPPPGGPPFGRPSGPPPTGAPSRPGPGGQPPSRPPSGTP